jgi:hypothetical protein
VVLSRNFRINPSAESTVDLCCWITLCYRLGPPAASLHYFLDATKTEQQSDQVDLLFRADFSRHRVLLGWTQAFREPGRSDEAEATMSFVQEHGSISLPPSGTATWERYNELTYSTVNTMSATSGLSEGCEYCGFHQNDHGSDHKAIRAHFLTGMAEHKENRGKQV